MSAEKEESEEQRFHLDVLHITTITPKIDGFLYMLVMPYVLHFHFLQKSCKIIYCVVENQTSNNLSHFIFYDYDHGFDQDLTMILTRTILT